MSIHKNELFDVWYDCESWAMLNNRNESVDIEELIKKLKERLKE